MSSFKKFTDFCAGAAGVICALFFIRQYMAFVPEEPPEPSISSPPGTDSTEIATDVIEQVTEKFPSKLEQFLTPTEAVDYSLLIPLAIILLLSAVLGRAFRRLPYVCFGISVVPALLTAYMFESDTLHTQEPMFLIISLLHASGNLVDCLMRDREDGRHRAWICAKISSAAGALLCFGTLWKGAQAPPEDADKIGHIENAILHTMTPTDVDMLITLGWMFIILFAVSLALYNVYFIDAILSVVPTAFVIYQTAGGYLTLAPLCFCVIAVICTLTHLALAVFENNFSQKEQLKQLKKAQSNSDAD